MKCKNLVLCTGLLVLNGHTFCQWHYRNGKTVVITPTIDHDGYLGIPGRSGLDVISHNLGSTYTLLRL